MKCLFFLCGKISELNGDFSTEMIPGIGNQLHMAETIKGHRIKEYGMTGHTINIDKADGPRD